MENQVTTVLLHLGPSVATILLLRLELEYPAYAFYIIKVELDVVLMPQFTLLSHYYAIAQNSI